MLTAILWIGLAVGSVFCGEDMWKDYSVYGYQGSAGQYQSSWQSAYQQPSMSYQGNMRCWASSKPRITTCAPQERIKHFTFSRTSNSCIRVSEPCCLDEQYNLWRTASACETACIGAKAGGRHAAVAAAGRRMVAGVAGDGYSRVSHMAFDERMRHRDGKINPPKSRPGRGKTDAYWSYQHQPTRTGSFASWSYSQKPKQTASAWTWGENYQKPRQMRQETNSQQRTESDRSGYWQEWQRPAGHGQWATSWYGRSSQQQSPWRWDGQRWTLYDGRRSVRARAGGTPAIEVPTGKAHSGVNDDGGYYSAIISTPWRYFSSRDYRSYVQNPYSYGGTQPYTYDSGSSAAAYTYNPASAASSAHYRYNPDTSSYGYTYNPSAYSYYQPVSRPANEASYYKPPPSPPRPPKPPQKPQRQPSPPPRRTQPTVAVYITDAGRYQPERGVGRRGSCYTTELRVTTCAQREPYYRYDEEENRCKLIWSCKEESANLWTRLGACRNECEDPGRIIDFERRSPQQQQVGSGGRGEGAFWSMQHPPDVQVYPLPHPQPTPEWLRPDREAIGVGGDLRCFEAKETSRSCRTKRPLYSFDRDTNNCELNWSCEDPSVNLWLSLQKCEQSCVAFDASGIRIRNMRAQRQMRPPSPGGGATWARQIVARCFAHIQEPKSCASSSKRPAYRFDGKQCAFHGTVCPTNDGNLWHDLEHCRNACEMRHVASQYTY